MERCSNRSVGLLTAGLAAAAALAVMAGQPGAPPPTRVDSAGVGAFEPSGVVRPLPPSRHVVTQAAYPPPAGGRRRAIFDWQSQGPALPYDGSPDGLTTEAGPSLEDGIAPESDDAAAPGSDAIIVLPHEGPPPEYPRSAPQRDPPRLPPFHLEPPLPDRTTSAEPERRSRRPRLALRPPHNPWGDDDAAAGVIPAPRSMPDLRPRPVAQQAPPPVAPAQAKPRPAPRSAVSAIPVMRRREVPSPQPQNETPHVVLGAPAPAVPTMSAGAPIERQHAPNRQHQRPSTGDGAIALPAGNPAPTSAIPDVVTRRALDEVRRGFDLADRKAYFSARNAFCEALRIVAEALDVESGTTRHEQALAAALRAVEESDEFVTDGSLPDVERTATAIAATHRTPVLRGGRAEVTSIQARRQYYTYSQEQFAAAVAGEPAGAAALFGLGKLHTVLTEVRPEVVAAAPSKALVYFQAALSVDPSHASAANELGVALAREGRYADARDWLIHSAFIAPRKETWHNLATVHDRLGEVELADRARAQVRLASERASASAAARIDWVDPVRFAARSELAAPAAVGANGAAHAGAPSSGAAPREQKRGLSRWLPWK